MKTPFSELQGPAKVLAICIVIVFVGSGLCGLEWAVAGALGGKGQSFLPAIVVLGIIQAIAIIVAVLVAFIALVVMIIRAISGRGARSDSASLNYGKEPETLFTRENHSSDDEKE
jgi:hypothetical protein